MRGYYGQPAFRKLLVWLNANDGSGYGCIELNRNDDISDFIAQLRNTCGKPVAEINYANTSNEDIIIGQQFLTMEKYRKRYGDEAILVITHLSDTADQSREEDVQALVNEINMNRENYVRYPSQVLFIFPIWFMDRLYQSAFDFVSMMGFHADLTAEADRSDLTAKADDNLVTMMEPSYRPAPNRKLIDIFRENFSDKDLPLLERLSAGKKYIDICAYYYIVDNDSLKTIGEILLLLADAERQTSMRKETRERIVNLEWEIFQLICSNPRISHQFESWVNERKYIRNADEIIDGSVRENDHVAERYISAGELLEKQGKYQEALDYYRKALSVQKRTFGEYNKDTAKTYNHLASTYVYLEEYDEALKCCEKSLAIQKMLEPENPDTAATYSNIASLYYSQGDYGKSLEYYGKALAIRERVLGTEHPDTAATYNNIALVYSKQGDYRKALEYYGKALAIRERVLGKEHPDTAATYNNIAELYRAQGNYVKALENYRKANAVFLSVLGEEHPCTQDTAGSIGIMEQLVMTGMMEDELMKKLGKNSPSEE
jgi:tetratricopeptide (TPR) repeat protein